MAKKKQNKRITSGGSVGRTPTQTIVLQPTRRGGLDVSEYMTAIRKAELIDYPQRKKLIDLYKDVMLDTHLMAVLRKQRSSILATPIQFRRNGKIDERMQEEVIESPWFFDFIGDLIDHEWQGVGGSLFQFYKEDGLIKYDLIPREHVDPINHTILRNPTDLRGESWDEFSDLLYVGNPRQIGDLAACAFWVILKRNNVSDWAELAEIFGRPIREGTYDAWDEKAREKLIEDIYSMGGAGVIIHPDGTNINLLQTGNVSGAGDMYSGLATYCNNEISKAVNGNTLTTEAGDKGTQALGTVQQDGEIDITLSIKKRILNILNYDLRNIFAALGINTEGGKFKFEPPEKKDPKQKVDIVCKLINDAGLPVSDDYLYEEFGIPKPDNYDQIKEQAQATAAAIREGKKEDKTEDPDADGDESTEPKGKKSTSPKNEDRKFIDRLRSFFGEAPDSAGADLDW